ncbi:hypothetical protein [Calidifontibacillus erzurumensis]|uniref:Uncharacterized protein n=1 Tax=Calidifontibacillus erzurumensis TaxID=2741433 RepID=A0A8J8KBQ8_9BACI|nr:hypothetical protein [Calidifontibacillus erzurumensis]NSL51293.1 hypothetical protein [Calidifontibacillus erzurumensis]
MREYFQEDSRLGILLPRLQKEWHEHSLNEQQQILAFWETERGKIPDRIKELETTINSKQAELDKEEDFRRSCQLNAEISELASIINDLWIWFRIDQNVIEEKIHG